MGYPPLTPVVQETGSDIVHLPTQRAVTQPSGPIAGATADSEIMRAVVRAYDQRSVRLYCQLRFQIIRGRFLEEIGQYLPTEGTVVDIGCGFGLFGLYFALSRPGLRIVGIDKQVRRIDIATKAAARLSAQNVSFSVGDAETYVQQGSVQAAYMLDILHHIPRQSAYSLITTLADALTPDGRLIIKDIETKPAYKVLFTWALDKAMDWRAPVDYWHPIHVRRLLESQGLTVVKHSMVDYLPYPHAIYVATKPR
jgi:2-polyprenyl-3-methyl-5-hydroxy-6-metoxy-1,4-benzoquinol methylase